MSDNERKKAMSFLGVAPLKTEGGWTDGKEPTPEELEWNKAQRQRERILDARMRAIPDVITLDWLQETVRETFAVAMREDQDELGWKIIRWIAEGRIRDVQGCCAEIAKMDGAA